MSSRNRLKTIADLKATLAQLDSEIVLLAQRTDGFGERVRAMLCGMTLARQLGVRFAFRWEGLDRPFDQSSPNAEEVFAPQFLARHQVTKEQIRQGKVIRLGDLSKLSVEQVRAQAASQITLYVEVAQHPVSGGVNPGDPEEWHLQVAKSASQIEYAPAIQEAISAAHDVADRHSSRNPPVAIHLRAGDIIYGNHRMLDRFHFKCCPYPIAQQIMQQEQSRGNSVLLFGQDNDMINYLKTTSQAVAATDLADSYEFDRLQKMVFEITLMSRCSTIYAGRSGFAILASLIGRVPQVQVLDHARKNALGSYLEAEVQSPRVSEIPPLQVSFAARWAMLLKDEAFPVSDSAVRLMQVCRKFDPENIRHALFSACYAQSRTDGAQIASEIEGLFGNELFRIGDVVRHLMPVKHRNPPLPEQCTSVFEQLAGLGDRRGVFAKALISADMGLIEEARQLSSDLSAEKSDHLSRTLERQLDATS